MRVAQVGVCPDTESFQSKISVRGDYEAADYCFLYKRELKVLGAWCWVVNRDPRQPGPLYNKESVYACYVIQEKTCL